MSKWHASENAEGGGGWSPRKRWILRFNLGVEKCHLKHGLGKITSVLDSGVNEDGEEG